MCGVLQPHIELGFYFSHVCQDSSDYVPIPELSSLKQLNSDREKKGTETVYLYGF